MLKQARLGGKLALFTPGAIKRGDNIFLYYLPFGFSKDDRHSLYRIDKNGKITTYALDIKEHFSSFLNIKDIFTLSDGSFVVLWQKGTIGFRGFYGLGGDRGTFNSSLLFFDKDGNKKFETDVSKGFVDAKAWTDGEHIYFQEKDLKWLDREGKIETIYFTISSPTSAPIGDIKFLGNYMYIRQSLLPPEVSPKVYYWQRVDLKNRKNFGNSDIHTPADGPGLFEMGENLWFVNDLGTIFKIDKQGEEETVSVADAPIYRKQDAIYTTYLRNSDKARVIEKINKDGTTQLIQEIKAQELKVVKGTQDNLFIFRMPYYPENSDNPLSKYIIFDADTEETSELVGWDLGADASIGKREILGRNVVDVGSKTIGILPTLSSMLDNNEIFKKNLNLLKEYARMNYVFEQLNDEEHSKMFSSLVTYADWIPAYIFIEDEIIKRGVIKEFRRIFDGLIDKTESIKQLRQLFKFINFVFEKTEDDKVAERIIKRWTNIYNKNRELADIIAAKMQEEFDTGKVLLGGGSLFSYAPTIKNTALEWYKESMDMTLLPSDIRLYLTYLTKEDLTGVLGIYQESGFEGEKEKMEITHRDLAALIRLPDEFPEKISQKDLDWQTILEGISKIEDKNLKGIQRDYTQSVNSQDKTQSYWIRELVQNSRDAIKDDLRDSVLNNDNKNKIISIKSGMSKNPNSAGYYEYINSVYDPVGMSAYTILNYLFPPDRSSKENGGSSGFFGHGLYTLFIPCDEVRIRTGKGQETYEFILKPYYDTGKNLLNIEVLRMAKYKSDFKGTEIQRIKYSKGQADEEPILDDLFLAMQTKRLVGGVSALGKDGVTILLNGEAINENMQEFETIRHPDLEAAIVSKFSPSKTQRITVDELLVDNIDYKYTQFIPKTVLDALLARGWNIDFPQGTPLPRTRNGLITPQKYASHIAVLALKSYIKLYMEDPNFEIYGLDKDYIYSREHPLSIPMEILHDAENINNGHPGAVDFSLYKDNPHTLVKLLTVINVNYTGEAASLVKIKAKVLEEYAKKDVKDVSLEGKLPEGMKNLQGIAEDFIKGDIGAKAADIGEEIMKEPIIKGFLAGCATLSSLIEKQSKYYDFTLVFNANFAAQGGGNRIIWNLSNYQNNLGAFLDFFKDKSSGLANLVEEFMHESGHTEQDIIRFQNKYIGIHQAEQDMHGALGWIMRQLLTRMVKKVDNMETFRKSLLQNTGYTLSELENSYKRVAEFVENKRKTSSP